MRKTFYANALLVMTACLPLAGMDGSCAGIDLPIGNNCGTSNVPAVRVTIVNENGDTLPYATIAFSIDGSEYFVGACDGECEDFTIAYDVAGRFNISVISPGYQQVDRTTNVATESDDCTPVTEDLIFVLSEDTTVSALAGAWRAQSVFGTIDLRFGPDGEAIGAILYDRTAAGDGNFYISYNNSPINGAAGQQITVQAVNDPTRVGDVFNFNGEAAGVPVGFIDAVMSADFFQLSGLQPRAQTSGIFVTYTRLTSIPAALQTP